MEQALLSAPGYRECDFLLVLQPHEALYETIRQEKEYFKQQYSCETTYGKPHITLVKFQQYEMMTPRIVQHLTGIAPGLQPIKVELKDYGSLPSHTIYINITSKVEIMDTVKALRPAQKLMKIDNDRKPFFITEPYLPIALKLQPWQYEQGWKEYAHKHFHGRFIADHMLLLKRTTGEMRYNIVKRFEFENKHTKAVQQHLF